MDINERKKSVRIRAPAVETIESNPESGSNTQHREINTKQKGISRKLFIDRDKFDSEFVHYSVFVISRHYQYPQCFFGCVHVSTCIVISLIRRHISRVCHAAHTSKHTIPQITLQWKQSHPLLIANRIYKTNNHNGLASQSSVAIRPTTFQPGFGAHEKVQTQHANARNIDTAIQTQSHQKKCNRQTIS